MENKVFEKNSAQIKKYDLKLYNDILMFDVEKSNIALTKTSKDEYNIVFNNIALHSQEGAVDEALKITSSVKDEKNSIKIIYGIGLGYLVDAMAEKLVNSKIIVYEPNLDILKFVFSIAQIDAIFKENVIVTNNKETFERHIKTLANSSGDISVSFLNSYKQLFFDDIKDILNIASSVQSELSANINTLLAKAPAALASTFANLWRIIKNPDISVLSDIYKNKTALVLSAGPSLKDNIEIIKNNQDKFVIFAVNPTIKLLSENNIKPDFIVDIETFNTSAQFSTIDTGDYYFILEGFTNHAVAKLKKKKTFCYLSDNFFNPWVKDCLKIKNNLRSTGTVSYSALASAALMGFNKIIVCGQDLAFKDGNCYAKGSQFEDLKCIWLENEKKYKIIANDFEKYAASFKTEKMSEKASKIYAQRQIDFLNTTLSTVKSQSGEDIPTQKGYEMFIQHFSELAFELKEKNPNLVLINASTGGAQIDGFENQKLAEIIAGLETIEKLDLENYNSKEPDLDFIKDKIDRLLKCINSLSTYSLELKEVNQKLLKELQIKKIFSDNAIKLLKKHREILSKLISLKGNPDNDYIIDLFLHKIFNFLEKNYIQNIETTKSVLIESDKILNYAAKYLTRYEKYLSCCKTKLSWMP